ncbi:hypothetical protein HMN09_00550800 [Mycena chlorophos]|uniref:Origin recognition complex subunit 5 n=1 Tax=Mycena chlorophos TaxID=658473 RepID=A0A8H6T875_MYCCL|nr:hypothetical protein HMN09_00550800 [Mycena chlorophos]
MSDQYPGYEPLVDELSSLISGSPPPFIFIHDPISARTSASVVSTLLKSRASDASTRVHFAHATAAACFHTRLLYDTVLNQLAQWQPQWEDGCALWGEERFSQNLDGFIHGMVAVGAHVGEKPQIAILIERAERLQDNMPELIVPLARLAELTGLNLCVIFLSDIPWEEIRPPFGGSPDPYYIDVGPLDKAAHVARLNRVFDELSAKTDPSAPPTAFHRHLRAFYTQFVETIVDICSLYVQDPVEIQYIVAARWPGFVQPILDAYAQAEDLNMNDEEELPPPPVHIRMQLIRHFKPSFKAALETLYPRHDHAASWAAAHAPQPNLLDIRPSELKPQVPKSVENAEDARMDDLPRMAKYLLIAAYLASTNPHTSDLRMFGRGLDEKKRKRRVNRVAPKGGVAKLPQRVLGPNPFPVERLTAILGALLEENDADRRPQAPEYTIPGEHTDMEVSRASVAMQIIELADAGLLQRTTTTDKLDGATFKCGISYKTAETLARQLDVALNDLLWDPA